MEQDYSWSKVAAEMIAEYERRLEKLGTKHVKDGDFSGDCVNRRMVLAFKLVVSLGLLVLLLIAVRLDLSRLRDRQFTILSWATLAALRVAVFVVLYLLVGLTPTSDNVVYFAEAKSALAGGVIYRDFESTYGPLVTYMNAAGSLSLEFSEEHCPAGDLDSNWRASRSGCIWRGGLLTNSGAVSLSVVHPESDSVFHNRGKRIE
jgi:hypothetical protein